MTGETITTAAELDALPVGSVVRDRDGDAWLRREHAPQRPGGDWFATGGRGWSKIWPPDQYAPLTVLFRPDAPQPATTDELIDALDIVRSEDYSRDQRDAAYERVADALAGRNPDTTDDAVERAAHPGLVAAIEHAMADERREGLSTGAAYINLRQDIRAALAAAGAGAEVGGEALADVIERHVVYAETGCAEDGYQGEQYAHQADAVLALLAARGDAVTPTEVEWGVRMGPRPEDQIVVMDEERARWHVRTQHNAIDDRLVQRTVSAWREVS